MAQFTITEGLAELKTIVKRCEKKRTSILSYLSRPMGLVDPLEKQGGSAKFIKEETQALRDLQNRHLAIRMAIQQANHTTRIKIGDTEMSVAEWLTWRKEQAPENRQFLVNIRSGLDRARRETQQRGGTVAMPGAEAKAIDLTVNIDEKALSENIEGLEAVEGALDGKLSLVNAVTLIEV